MKAKISTILSFIACLIALVCTIWISFINLLEIVARANGQYTFYSQRATLNDDEAVLYFSGWTLLFIVICWLSIKNLLRKRAADAIIYAVVLLLLILLSTFVDKLFYHKLTWYSSRHVERFFIWPWINWIFKAQPTMNGYCSQHCICAIVAKEYRPSAFVILIICSNLAVLIILKSYGQASCGNSIIPTAQMRDRCTPLKLHLCRKFSLHLFYAWH